MVYQGYNPPLSIVVTARNDEHGGNLLQRMQLFLNGIIDQSKRFDLEIELILVEWNPPRDRQTLVQVLDWPLDSSPCYLRAIEVPLEIHKRFRHCNNLPLFQMLAKNVGIRRASGRFILATNIDVLFTDELMRFIGSRTLDNNCFYRVDRYDVSLGDFQDLPHELILEKCKQNIIRICEFEGIRDSKDGKFYRIHGRKNLFSLLRKKMEDWCLVDILAPPALHTNACGDFTLMAREKWFDLRGYPELEMFSFHLDSLLCHAAYNSGLKEKRLKDPMRIYHIEHSTGSGYTPEGHVELDKRIDEAGIPRITDERFNELALRMSREKRPIIFAREDWGLSEDTLPETAIYRIPKRKISKKRSQIKKTLVEGERKGEPKEKNYLILDPRYRMAKNPLISVIVPCLNRANFLVPTIESILQQDYSNIECIVIDGGSTDGTIEILKGYGDRIKWVSEPDSGHAHAIDKGWRMCKGEILAWLNADDLWEVPGTLGKVVDLFRNNPEVSLVYGDCGRIDEEGFPVGISYLHEWDLGYAVECCDHCIPQPAAFIRRDILEKVGWLDTDFQSKKDHELWLRIGLEGEIRHLAELLAYARDIEGLSQDGKTVSRSCIQVTKKFFSLPNVPKYLKRRKRWAISNSYLRGMDYAFAGGRLWKIVLLYAFRSVLAHPGNIFNLAKVLYRNLSAGAWEGVNDNRLSYRIAWLIIRFSMGSVSLVSRAFRKIIRAISRADLPLIPNLLGDRDIEWSWIASQMPQGPGNALDFGSGGSHLALVAAQMGFKVKALDLQIVAFPYIHPNLRHVRGDILSTSLPLEHYDLVINCSTVEHVGLAGRYGVTETRTDGDLEAMAKLKKLMKTGGVMLMTIPVGKDAICTPFCRIYGKEMLPLLLQGYVVEKETYWMKDDYNRWVPCSKNKALGFKASVTSWNPLRNVYALGCFVLRNN